uniref:EGF-like domain-containing protein n=1 Tax=Romanomermis culicivorax TaxID=13658 RepID=A0A915L1Q1_ROMCU
MDWLHVRSPSCKKISRDEKCEVTTSKTPTGTPLTKRSRPIQALTIHTSLLENVPIRQKKREYTCLDCCQARKRGCRTDFECAKNAACIPISVESDCGVCVCNDGFEPVGVKRCRKVAKSKAKTSKRAKTGSTSIKNEEDVIIRLTSQTRITSMTTTKIPTKSTSITTTTPETSTSTSTSTTTQTSTTTTSTPTKTTATSTVLPTTLATATMTISRTSPQISQGSIPILFSLNCADYDCVAEPTPSVDASPLIVRTSCKSKIMHDRVACNSPLASNLPDCNGVYCLDNEETQSSYCICPYDKIGSSCLVDKPGKCSHGTGLLPIDQILRKNTRFVHRNMPELGDIVARHFASSWIECVKLCQWTDGECKAINFGQINNVRICELLSVAVIKDNTMLQSWLQEQTGWTYVCCL